MPYASSDDVAELLARELTTEEQALVERRLAQVERMILRRIPDLAAQIAAETIAQDDVVDVEAEAVYRVVRNPEGLHSENDGSYGYQLSSEAADNRLRIPPRRVERAGCEAQPHVHDCPEPQRDDAAMSLLNRGTELVKVFQEVQTPDTDADGNKITRAALVGTLVRAVVQPLKSTEDNEGGFNTESRYRLRLVNYPNVLGTQSQIEWRGKRYSIEGDALIYNGSLRTARAEYVMVCS